jgi:hypothetical protein
MDGLPILVTRSDAVIESDGISPARNGDKGRGCVLMAPLTIATARHRKKARASQLHHIERPGTFGTMPLPTYSHCKRSMPPGTRACPTTYATIPPAKPSRSLSISTSMLSPQSSRPAAMGGIEEGRPAKKSP